MPHPHHALAHRFFTALSAGAIPDDLLTDDATAWTTTSGAQPGARYKGGIPLFASIFDGGLTYTVDSLTAEDDRVACEVRSAGTLSTGEPFANTYMFMLRVRDGRIASVAEHFDPGPVREKIVPLIQAKMAAAKG